MLTELTISNTLYNGMLAISAAHQDVPPLPPPLPPQTLPKPSDNSSQLPIAETSDLSNASITPQKSVPNPSLDDTLVSSELALIFDGPTVAKIVSLLNGTTIYSQPATLPAQAKINIPSGLIGRVQYMTQDPGTLQITGILRANEIKTLLSLSKEAAWIKAVSWCVEQPGLFFNQTLSGIIPSSATDTRDIILAPDVPAVAPGASPSGMPAISSQKTSISKAVSNDDPGPLGSAPAKRFQLLSYFEPFLRRTLTTQLIDSTLASFAALSTSTTQLLLQNVLTGTSNGKTGSAFDSLQGLVAIGQVSNSNSWSGYLIPPSTDYYTFAAPSKGSSITIGHEAPQMLDISQENVFLPTPVALVPDTVFLSNPIPLVAGNIYPITIHGITVSNPEPSKADQSIKWQSARSPRANIPASALLPASAQDTVKDILIKLSKVALIISILKLSNDETTFWNATPAYGSNPRISFETIDIDELKRLSSYCKFRDNLPPSDSTLLDLFSWATTASDNTGLAGEIAKVTGWVEDTVSKLIAPNHFNIDAPTYFQDETQLLKLQRGVMVATSTGVDVNSLFDWSLPLMKFWPAISASKSIQKTIRARFTVTNWEQVIQPLNNTIRENSKNALISYLLLQPELRSQKIKDADGLFEFFLIDVQMSCCLQTSRIKQAISTVQLFIERCLLGLEPGTPPIDKKKWESMQTQPLYAVRRKFFLYPESYLQEPLRDDKTEIYQQLETSLAQNDVTLESATAAIQTYLFQLDAIANLQTVGMYYDDISSVIIIARTQNPPYLYYYRTFSTNNNWTSWQTMQVDIPDYNLYTKADPNQISGSGTYITPFVWGGRIFVVFPQFSMVSKPQSLKYAAVDTFDSVKGKNISDANPQKIWQIQICWSELRGGVWSPKQLCPTVMYASGPIDTDLNVLLSSFVFVPNLSSDPISIDTFRFPLESSPSHTQKAVWIGRSKLVLGSFLTETISDESDPTKISNVDWSISSDVTIPVSVHFQYQLYETIGSDQKTVFDNRSFYSFKVSGDVTGIVAKSPNVKCTSLSPSKSPTPTISVSNTPTVTFTGPRSSSPITFNHTYSDAWVKKIAMEGVDALFTSLQQGSKDMINQKDLGTLFGAQFNELTEPYSIYNWELLFHAPMELVNQLRLAQQYDKALTLLQYIFDPRVADTTASVWKFPPFNHSTETLESFFRSLAPGVENTTITTWRNDPFSPFVVARSRPVAFMKWVVMTYINILVDWGDYYFRQNTLESVPLAIQLYVSASHLFGPAPQAIPKQGKVKAETYESLLNAWDAFDNAVVDLELAMPFSNQMDSEGPPPELTGVTDTPNIFGFATTRYFCIPNNPDLKTLRAKIDDRLFKIRHCQDINGAVRMLSLWEPPLDPNLILAAAAAGLSIATVLNDLCTPLPNFRFVHLLDRAMGMVNQLRSFGDSFLSVKEKQDGEALSVLRAQQDAALQDLITVTKESQITAAKAAIGTLSQQRAATVQRMRHHLQVTGDDQSIIPDSDSPFQEIVDSTIEAPGTDGQLRLNKGEQLQLDLAEAAGGIRFGTQVIRAVSSILLVQPTFKFYEAPLGIGVVEEWGPSYAGHCVNAVADGILALADFLAGQSQSAGTRAAHIRTLQDRRQIINESGFQISTFDKQIAEQQLRITIASQELSAQQTSASNAKAVQSFLKTKYSNVALYTWMESQVRSLYYQTYTLAYDLAKSAETAYHFERPQDTQTYIQYGYWDPSRDGLYCGDRLFSGLEQLSSAYRLQRGWDFELSKYISLKRINPLSWLQLRESASCQFDIPEILFDLDFPGHYNRRIKSVDITIPCVVGPYAQANCTLRLLKHQYRVSAAETSGNNYEEATDDDDRFRTCVVPIDAIATSSSVNDAGVFELSFEKERYMPFEGAGVISTWQLDLPRAYQQFDYSTINDVILHFNYTSLDGGTLLKAAATQAVQNFVTAHQESRDLYTIFDVPNEFPGPWQKALNPTPPTSAQTLVLENMTAVIPVYYLPQQKTPTVSVFIHLISSGKLDGSTYNVEDTIKDPPPAFSSLDQVAGLFQYSTDQVDVKPKMTWTFTFSKTSKLDRLWMLVRYWYHW